jgi:phospho-N-acetylmuramoyl-pentapeptide-transferase
MVNFAIQKFWLAFGVSAVLSWPSLILLRRVGVVSLISKYAPEAHQTKKGTPNMGGIFVVLGASAALIPVSSAGLLVLLGFALIGFLDDFVVPRVTSKRGLGWVPKLVLELVVVSAFVVLAGVDANSITAAFFVLFFANAINFADGLDALAATLLIVSLIPFCLFFLATGNTAGIAMSLGIPGALIPFLFLNAPPAKIFMGDVGALALGAVYGLLFSASPWQSSFWPWVVSFIFIVELILVPIQIAAVKTIGRRVVPATPVHHSFEKIGWPESKVVWTFAATQLLLSAVAITVIYS